MDRGGDSLDPPGIPGRRLCGRRQQQRGSKRSPKGEDNAEAVSRADHAEEEPRRLGVWDHGSIASVIVLCKSEGRGKGRGSLRGITCGTALGQDKRGGSEDSRPGREGDWKASDDESVATIVVPRAVFRRRKRSAPKPYAEARLLRKQTGKKEETRGVRGTVRESGKHAGRKEEETRGRSRTRATRVIAMTGVRGTVLESGKQTGKKEEEIRGRSRSNASHCHDGRARHSPGKRQGRRRGKGFHGVNASSVAAGASDADLDETSTLARWPNTTGSIRCGLSTFGSPRCTARASTARMGTRQESVLRREDPSWHQSREASESAVKADKIGKPRVGERDLGGEKRNLIVEKAGNGRKRCRGRRGRKASAGQSPTFCCRQRSYASQHRNRCGGHTGSLARCGMLRHRNSVSIRRRGREVYRRGLLRGEMMAFMGGGRSF
eukprot:TRINITY_DN29530_c0_g2_i1.p1 TRINITY_DN29530_c0_g2~~TRINITY_DN29530_c0_g2_i1.p1  ORF type:complete len:436 (-),score=60.04 TRINITY_DN29530_c0_g2_i1:378-1685(-)